jgi:uncharacterized protein (DUF3084 family)
MNQTPEQIKSKIEKLKKELIEYQTTEQNVINDMTQAVQQRVRTAQKHVDNLEGQIAAWASMLAVEPQALAPTPPPS